MTNYLIQHQNVFKLCILFDSDIDVQTFSEAHLASYSVGTGGCPWIKRAERETDPSPPSSAEVKNE
jgi:hypothetical protein